MYVLCMNKDEWICNSLENGKNQYQYIIRGQSSFYLSLFVTEVIILTVYYDIRYKKEQWEKQKERAIDYVVK